MDGSDLERLHELHFELSNEDRLNILLLLKEKPEKLTKIAKDVLLNYMNKYTDSISSVEERIGIALK